ncbi:unnamed protein product, partial [Effrenium voratum]
SILDDLTVRNVFLMLMSSSYGRAGGLDAESDADESQDSAHELRTASRAVDDSYDGDSEWKLETRFGTEYLEAALAESWLSMWESAEPQRRLHVPPPNRFIATDFNILPDALPEELLPDLPRSGYDGFPIPQARRLRTPSLTSSEGLKMWHLPCAQQFEQPRSLLTLKLTSPYYALDLSSVRKEVLLELYCECLKDNLNETLYSASKAKLHCSFRESMYGLSLGAGGFSQKLLALVETMLQGLRLETYAMHRFRAQREELLRGYKNAWLKPQAHCAQLRKLLLLPATLRPAQREAELSACGESELSDFVKNFCSEGSWELLVSGNTRKDELTSWIHASLATQLPMRSTTVVEPDVVQLNAQTAAVWLQSGLDSTQTNSAVEIYFQLPGRDSWDFQQDRVRTRMLLELLEDMMYENVYDELRTKQQLGYSVGCNMRDSFGVLGFSIYVLSAVQRPPVLLERVDAFLKDFTRQLREWPSEKLLGAKRELQRFGKELEKIDIPKYRGNYIQYKELKKAIKVFTGQDKDNASVKEVTHWTSSFLRLGPNPDRPPEARLNEVLTGELNRVSKFAALEEAAIKERLEALLKDARASSQEEELCQRYEELGTDVSNLKSFSQVNFSGFRKALKKYDKWSRKSTMQWFMSQVVKAPLMCVDFEAMLHLLTDIGSVLRKKGVKLYQDVKCSPSSQEEYTKGLERGGLERTFLLEAKAAMNLRVKLAAFMSDKYPEERASTAGGKQRPKQTSLFLDTPQLQVYKDVLDHYSKLHEEHESSCPASLHVRSSERGQVVCAVYQAKGDKGRKEVLLRNEDVVKLLRGEATMRQSYGVPSSSLDSRAVGARAVMGCDPPMERSAASSALQEVISTFGSSLAPQAQATYSRSLLQDGSGVVVILDEDVRFGKIQEFNGATSSTDFFDFMVITIVFPSRAFSLPRWLGLLEDGSVVQANGFSKGAHAIARFHALGQSLPMPHWYANVYSDAQGGEGRDEADPQSAEPAGGQKGIAKNDVDTKEKEEIVETSPRWTHANANSARLLHEFGTTPQQESQMAATRMALAARGTSSQEQEAVRKPAAAGSLSEPLLEKTSEEQAPQGMLRRIFGVQASEDQEKAVRRAIVAVQPKTLYSNERTFLEWIHFATILAASGVLMLHAGEAGHVIIGRLLVLAAIFLVVWSMHVFNWRADGLDFKVDMRYEDNVGPVALVVSILGALLLSSLHAVFSADGPTTTA